MIRNFKKIRINSRYYSLNLCSKDVSDFLQKTNLSENHNFINGKRTNGAGVNFDNINPATGEILTPINSCSTKQIDDCITKSKVAQENWSILPNHEKSKILLKSSDLIRSKCKIISTIDVLDTGKPFWEAENDIIGCADCIQMFASFLYSFQGSYVSTTQNSFYYTRREPLGVCAGIGAWNFPFQMITWKSAPALAAGNSFIFKPSNLTPLSAILLAEIYHEAGVPEGLISVVQGGGEVGSYLVNHPDIAKISFTGSVSTGKKIMKDSSNTLKQLTLELGGKSPLIIFQDADLTDSIKGTILANFLTQGEVCSNGTRVYIHSAIYSQFETQLIEAIKTLKIGDPFDPSVAIGAIISADHYKSIMSYIDLARGEGAKILFGGNQVLFPDNSPLAGGKYVTPCVIGHCDDGMRVVREEIFGPVVCLLKFDTEQDVVERANDSDLGLCGGVFTRDLNRAHRIASKLQCGTVYINTYNAYPIGIPFGGTKQSGFGRENCLQSLDHYSHIKSTFVESNQIDYPFWPNK